MSLRSACGFLAVGVVAGLCGCALNPMNGFLDPTKVGQFPGEYKEGGIRRVLTPRESPFGLANATDPKPEDLVAKPEEYRLGPDDQIAISIDDFMSQGIPYQTQIQIDDKGYIRLPQLGLVKVAGMTEDEFEADLRSRIIQAKLLPRPIVQVQTPIRRERTFSILGSIRTAGTYPIPYGDLRLLDAVGLAGDMGAGVRKIYVIRRSGYRNAPAGGEATSPATLEKPTAPAAPKSELVVPPPDEKSDLRGSTLSTTGGAALAQDSAGDRRREMESVLAPAKSGTATAQSSQSAGGRAFAPLVFDPATGELKEAPTGAGAASLPSGSSAPFQEPTSNREFSWDDEPDVELPQRVIEIDVNGLKGGDPKQNIVVRNRDTIIVPIDVGIFYVAGEVNRPGAYPFNDREITVKQAIAVVGGFAALAWPSRCEIVRREKGTDKQITIPVNIDSIFAGLEDDILLKDDDILNVGSNIVAPFLFVIRNSFRFTYGFGFVYDRNFADQDSIGGRTNPEVRAEQRRAQRGLPF